MNRLEIARRRPLHNVVEPSASKTDQVRMLIAVELFDVWSPAHVVPTILGRSKSARTSLARTRAWPTRAVVCVRCGRMRQCRRQRGIRRGRRVHHFHLTHSLGLDGRRARYRICLCVEMLRTAVYVYSQQTSEICVCNLRSGLLLAPTHEGRLAYSDRSAHLDSTPCAQHNRRRSICCERASSRFLPPPPHLRRHPP